MITAAVSRPAARLAFLAIAPVAVLLAYAASPYVALWRLSEALRNHDCAALRIAIDWQKVRDGLATELSGPDQSPAGKALASVPSTGFAAGSVAAVHAAAAAEDDDLPAFGESFASNAVGHALTEDVTPEHVSDMIATAAPLGSGGMIAEARHALAWAFFTGPGSFEVWLRPGHDVKETPMRVRMVFTRQHGWRVTNVWVPQDLLGAGATHNT